jgi:hypothetical protein
VWEKKSELVRRVQSILLGGKRMGTAQARMVLGVLVLGLLGGSAELARCPQLVSFSGTALPVSAAAPSSSGAGLGYVPVAFHGSVNGTGERTGIPHATLLKASMPADRTDRPVNPRVVKQRRATRNSILQHSKQNHAGVREARGWVVLTSWDGSERRGMVLSVAQERVIFTSYAAVPTAGGWLVIQL